MTLDTIITREIIVTKIQAWHFVGAALRDGAPIPADGVTLRHDGPLTLCASGFHASVRLIDALYYAPGATLCRVTMGGEIIHESDKVVATERTILWRIDATELLRLFARQCALDVAHLWRPPGMSASVRKYLETGDEKLRAAGDAARAAAMAAGDAGDAARAARAAARAAASSAAWAAAWAAWAARAAAEAAGDAGAAQNTRLEAMAYTAAGRRTP